MVLVPSNLSVLLDNSGLLLTISAVIATFLQTAEMEHVPHLLMPLVPLATMVLFSLLESAEQSQPVLPPNTWMSKTMSALTALSLKVVLLELADPPTIKVSLDLLGNIPELLQDNTLLFLLVLILNMVTRSNIILLPFLLKMVNGFHVMLLIHGVKIPTHSEFHLDLVSATVGELWILVISKPSSTSLLELKSPLPLSNSP